MNQQILLIATGKPFTQLKQYLNTLRYSVISIGPTDKKLQPFLTTEQKELVIVIHNTSCDDHTLSLLQRIQQQAPKPVALFVDTSTEQQSINAVNAGANAYVVDGIQEHRIEHIVTLAIARFERCMGLREELKDTQQKLNERKVIDRAKGILMNSKGFSEDEAYQFLRNKAMERHLRVGVFAQTILDAAELLG